MPLKMNWDKKFKQRTPRKHKPKPVFNKDEEIETCVNMMCSVVEEHFKNKNMDIYFTGLFVALTNSLENNIFTKK